MEDDASTKESLIIYFAITGIIIVPIKNNLKSFILASFFIPYEKKILNINQRPKSVEKLPSVYETSKINLVFKYEGMLKSSLFKLFPKI